MDEKTRILFIFLTLTTIRLINGNKHKPNFDDIAPQLMVSHHDCGEMTENRLYALNQVKPCLTSPENLETSTASVTLYTKHFRRTVNATMCRVKHQREKWYCGNKDHSSMDNWQYGLTTDVDLSSAQCKLLAEGKSINVMGQDIHGEKGKKIQIVKNFGEGGGFVTARKNGRNECDGRAWITRDSYEVHIQDVELKVNTRTGKIHNVGDYLLPCGLDELGCESTSLDPYAYVWDNPDNCILAVLRQEQLQMIKNNKQYYMISKNDTQLKFLFEVKNNPQHYCHKPEPVYPTNYDSLYVAIHHGGFEMNSGRKLGHNPNGYVMTYVPLSGQDRLDLQYDSRRPDIGSSLNLDYELHVGTKVDYLLYESSRSMQASELQLLKNQCEQERTQILTVLMLSLENPRLAGYMLTGNRSMFLNTDGSLAWLYHCPKFSSPLHTLKTCYDRIPIFYQGSVQFVDPISRLTYPDANTQNCTDKIKNLYQLDMDDKDSWFTLTPSPEHRDRPAIFGPKDVSPFTKNLFSDSQNAGMYTQTQLTEFWDNILISAASRNALQKFSRELIVPGNAKSGPDNYMYHGLDNKFYVDNLISPNSSNYTSTNIFEC